MPFADRRFRTPSGRFEFLGEFVPPAPLSQGLHFVATKTLRMLNSQVLPEDLPAEPAVAMHPKRVSRLGLADGQRVRVVSSVGAVEARLVVDAAVRQDVVLFNPAFWQGGLSGVNQLREAWVTDLGESAAMHATAVTVLPA